MIDLILLSFRVRLRRIRHLIQVAFSAPKDRIAFECNVCGRSVVQLRGAFGRERESCPRCGSSVRKRAIVLMISKELYGEDRILNEFTQSDKTIIGISDYYEYSDALKKNANYSPTYLHKEPRLDLMHVEEWEGGAADIVTCFDILEHVDRPVETAIKNLRKLTNPDGVCLITVPYIDIPLTIEHFPLLSEVSIRRVDGVDVLQGIRESGQPFIASNLVFHGYDGEVLEKRMFSRTSLLLQLELAGFTQVHECVEDVPFRGIVWEGNGSRPIVARAS